MVQNNTKKNETSVETQSKLTFRYHTPTVNISDFLDNILNVGLLDLTKLGNLFQIKNQRTCTELKL